MKRFIKSIFCVSLALMMVLSVASGFDFSAEAKAESQRDAIVRVALTQEGVSGCPNKYTFAFGEIDGSYNWPWCAAFIYWCAQQVGIPHSIIKRTAESGVNSFQTPCYKYTAFADVQKGDILYMENNNSKHIGLVADVDDEFIYTVEGNVKNTVTCYKYNRSDGYSDWSGFGENWQKIVYYGVPNYENMKAEPEKVLYPEEGIYKITSSYREGDRTDYDYLNFSKEDNNIHVRTNLDGLRDSTRVRCQYFTFTHVSDGWYTITNIGTGLAMEVADGDTAPGTNIQQGYPAGSDSQLFRFYDAGDGLCYIKSKIGCYVDIQTEDYTVNDNVWTYKFNGTATQKWKLHSHTHSNTSEITKKATCSEEGSITYTCSVCRLIYDEVVPKTEHSMQNGTCTACGYKEEVKAMPGDVDGDERITASDARLTLRFSVGLDKPDAAATAIADVDKDSRITAGDARLILRASVGLEDPATWL